MAADADPRREDGILTVGSLFSGIGGIDLGLERTGGFRTAWFSEVDPYASAVLEAHWPDVPNLGDVRTIGGDASSVDVLAGGFPCQPVSLAGRRLGQFDDRWLWPEFARLVGELRPRVVLVENVPGLASKGLGLVLEDLSALGYDAEWDVVSASSVGAPHLRERLFLVAYPGGQRRQQDAPGPHGHEGPDGWGSQEDHIAPGDGQGHRPGGVPGPVAAAERGRQLADSERPTGGGPGTTPTEAVFRPEAVERLGRRRLGSHWHDRPLEPGVRLVAHGVPDRLARLRAAGNAVVPQCAEFVGHLILEALKEGRL